MGKKKKKKGRSKVTVITGSSYQQPTFGGYQYGTTQAYKSCDHYGERPFLTWAGGASIFPTKVSQIEPTWYNLVIDLAGGAVGASKDALMPFRDIRTDEPKEREAWAKLNDFAKKPPVSVRFNWPDRDAPPIKFEGWPALIRLMQSYKEIGVCCIGSHGRTGTFLACCLICSGKSAEAAIDLVRKRHCSKAIESKVQEDYLAGLEKYIREDDKRRIRRKMTVHDYSEKESDDQTKDDDLDIDRELKVEDCNVCGIETETIDLVKGVCSFCKSRIDRNQCPLCDKIVLSDQKNILGVCEDCVNDNGGAVSPKTIVQVTA